MGPLLVLRRHLGRGARPARVGLRQRSRSEAQLRHAEQLGHLGGTLPELERPHRIGRVHLHRPVPRDARRPRVARDRGADDVRPALDELGHAGLRPEARRARPGSRYRADPCSHLHELRGLDGQRRGVRRRDHRLAHARDTLCEHTAAAEVELGEHVVEQQERRHRRGALPRRAGARAPRAVARPASRTGAGHVARSRSSRRRGAGRAPSCRGRCRARAAPRAPRRSVRPRRRRAPRRAGRARPHALRTRVRAQRASRGAARRAALRALRSAPSTARARRGRRGRAARGAALRSAARASQGSPAGVPARAGKSRPSVRSKYALRAAGPPLTTARRSGVKTSVATSRRSDSADGRRAPFSSASFACPWRSVSEISTGERAARAADDDAACGLAELDQLRRPAACAARSPASRRAATRAGSSCRRRFGRRRARSPGARSRSSDAYER